MASSVQRTIVIFACVAALMAGGGCQSEYRQRAKRLDASMMAGDIAGAAEFSYQEFKKDSNERDRVVRALDAGSVLMMAGRYSESREALTQAYQQVRPYLDTKAENSASEGVVTTAVNQTLSEYKATPVERILLNTVLAVDQMAIGKSDLARIELNRANDWQQDARNRYMSAIEKDKAAAERKAREQGVDLNRAMRTPGLSRLTEGLDAANSASGFQSPWTSYLRAAFLRSTSTNVSDIGTARSELRSVWEMSPAARPTVEAELADLESGGTQKMTWVFAFSGLCPRREELRLDIPIPIGPVNYVSAAFPMLRQVTGSTSNFLVSAGGAGTQAQLLMDVEATMTAEYKEQIPVIIAQEIMSSVLKTAMTFGARESSRDRTASLLAQLGGIIYQAATTAADLREWRTLPRHIFVARVPTPANGNLTISVPGAAPLQVIVDPSTFNGVIVWHTQPTSPTISGVTWRMQ